ncbi:tetratricopeptide repeat protein [Pelotalea chapellei]|uniref:Tetratricopeptide repeat protein n=1 Tax=Pelotalea chapellei TaxID=44671 RepID=A0ABS5UAI6_9BACT|nr:tetratricopeptide repeat protein [Pelotalea chapellei]MBT1072697.1 tetratricopeptide repeat protein [Pelotalea chapellei]
MITRLLYFIFLLALGTSAGCATTGHPEGNQAAYHYQMGLSYLGERNYTNALIELTEAEKLDPENPELLYHLGMAYLGKKRPDLAEKRLQRALTLKPNYAVARNDLGVAYLELKRWDNAIQQFKIVKDDIFYDKSEDATINLGLAYLGKGDYPKALEELRSVAALNPRNPVIRLSLGRVWFAMDKLDQAIAEYSKALEIYNDYGAAHYHLGLAYLKMNNLEAAKASFKEVLRIFPDSDLGRLSQGYLELIK